MNATSSERLPVRGSLGYTLRREAVDEFYSRQVLQVPGGSRVLDLGGTRLRKRGEFDVDRYEVDVIYVNLAADKGPHVVADAAHLPFAETCFDVVICAELLEHVQDPPQVLAEAQRVLRPGGVLLITVPFLYRVHGDPCDFGRYTEHYWHVHLERLGFGSLTIERQGLFWSVWADMWREALAQSGRSGWLRWRPLRGLAAVLFRCVRRRVRTIERRPEYRAHPRWSSYTTGYGIRGVKL